MRGLVPQLNAMWAQLAPRADVVVVYCLEAHATDEWPIASSRATHDGQPINLAQPHTNAARAAAHSSHCNRFYFDFESPHSSPRR